MHQYSFECNRLEVGLEIINVLVTQGEKVLEAQLSETTGTMLLPVDAFDGSPCLGAIKKLQKEWRTLLKKPLQPALKTVHTPNQEHIKLTEKRFGNWKKKQESYVNLVTFLEMALQKTPCERLLIHYQSLLTTTQRRLKEAQISCQLLADHLTELSASN